MHTIMPLMLLILIDYSYPCIHFNIPLEGSILFINLALCVFILNSLFQKSLN